MSLKLKFLESKLQEGDIVLERNYGLVPDVICDCMKIKGKKLGLYDDFIDSINKEGYISEIYNHSDYIIRKDNSDLKPCVYSAFQKGVDYKSISHLLRKEVKSLCILRFNKKINDNLRSSSLLRVQSYARQYKGRKYDYPSLLFFHPIDVFLNIWKGKKGDDALRFLFCYEITQVMANHWTKELTNLQYFENYHKANFWYFVMLLKLGVLEIVWEGGIN